MNKCVEYLTNLKKQGKINLSLDMDSNDEIKASGSFSTMINNKNYSWQFRVSKYRFLVGSGDQLSKDDMTDYEKTYGGEFIKRENFSRVCSWASIKWSEPSIDEVRQIIDHLLDPSINICLLKRDRSFIANHF